MKKMFLMIGFSLSLFATEIVVDGQYATELKNPFLEKLGSRSKSVKIPTKARIS